MAEETKVVNGIDSAKLLSYVERIENLNAEIKALQEDIKEIGEEAKSNNLDFKAIKKLVQLRKKDKMKRDEDDYILSVYREAINV